jgi:hypothetical protein
MLHQVGREPSGSGLMPFSHKDKIHTHTHTQVKYLIPRILLGFDPVHDRVQHDQLNKLIELHKRSGTGATLTPDSIPAKASPNVAAFWPRHGAKTGPFVSAREDRAEKMQMLRSMLTDDKDDGLVLRMLLAAVCVPDVLLGKLNDVPKNNTVQSDASCVHHACV